MEEEQQLIERWRRGSHEAAHALVQRHYPRLLNLFYRLTGERSEAEELTQELFVRLTGYIVRGGRVESLTAWLNQTALNLWRDRARRAILARTKGIAAAGGDEVLERLSGGEPVEATVLGHWERDAVRQALLDLSPPHREAIVLYHYQQLTYAQIADLTGVPIGTVRSRIHYAVDQLRRRLAGEGGTEPWLNEGS
ncbi:MAG: RNA polymerase sigma factor [Mycobacterium leprae]